MRNHLSKKLVVLAAIVAVALAIASGVAYAYFTATGAGTGSATVGSATNIVLTPTITGTLYPGGTPASVSILVKNNGAGAQHVGTVSLASIAPAAETPRTPISSRTRASTTGAWRALSSRISCAGNSPRAPRLSLSR